MVLPLSAWNRLVEALCEVEQSVKDRLGMRNTLGDRIIIEDEVLVYEGKRLLFKSKGHIVNQGLIGIKDLWCMNAHQNVSGYYENVPSNQWGTRGTIRVGTGTGVTTATMTALVSENATAPSSHSGAITNPDILTYRVAWVATWNAGVLPAITLTEMGLKLYLYATDYSFGATGSGTPTANRFASRLSSSDGDFTAFVVNPAVPLTVEWRLTFSFA